MDQTCTAESATRIDQCVALHFTLSRSQASQAIEEGRVLCNGSLVTKAAKQVQSGDTITLRAKEVNDTHMRSTPELPAIDVPILYEDRACMVALKPVGISVHGAPSMDDNETTLIDVIAQRHAQDDPQLVHRLDKGTTGCILIAKSAAACEALQKQFQERSIRKEYLTIVHGVPDPAKATIDAPIGRSLVNRTKMSLFRTGTSKNAKTTYVTISSTSDVALLRCTIHTGRTHQIRVHLSSVGHPLLGDEKYASSGSRALNTEHGFTDPLLHAALLTFVSPDTHKEVCVEAPLPTRFHEAISKLSLDAP